MLSAEVKRLMMGDGAINEWSWSSGPSGNGGHLGNRNRILTTCKKPPLQTKALGFITECTLHHKVWSSLLLIYYLMNTEFSNWSILNFMATSIHLTKLKGMCSLIMFYIFKYTGIVKYTIFSHPNTHLPMRSSHMLSHTNTNKLIKTNLQ